MASVNVNGLKTNSWTKLRELHKIRLDVIFLQETKLNSPENTRDIIYRWHQISLGSSFLNPASAERSGGVGILLSHRATLLLKNCERVTSSAPTHRYIGISATLHDMPITLHSIYAPVQRGYRAPFFDALPVTFTSNEHVVGGDFNSYLDTSLDTNRYRNTTPEGARNLTIWMAQLGLRDIWRIQHPTLRTYTSPTNTARIDRILATQELASKCTTKIIGRLAGGDHSCPTATFTTAPPRIGKQRWQMPSWAAKMAAPQVRSILTRYSSLHSTSFNAQHFAAMMKDIVKTCRKVHTNATLHRSDRVARARHRWLQCHTIAVHEPTSENIRNAWEAKQQLQQITKETEELKLAMAFDSHLKHEETSSRKFFSRNRPRYVTTTIPGVQTSDGEISSEKQTIAHEHIRFWSQVFSHNGNGTETPPSAEQIKTAMEDIPIISRETRQDLDTPLSPTEIEATINRLAPYKSAGPDGLRAELFRQNSKVWSKVLAPLFEELLHTETPLPQTFTESIITLIYKKGNPNCPGNYRPISLINVIRKIMTGTINARLRIHLDAIVPYTQTGFIPGRSITENILLINDALHYARRRCPEAIVLSLDFAKAYDRVQWPFLFETLLTMGFGTRFCNAIRKIYQQRSTRLIINGELTEPFEITRGTQQGDPISPSLFILQSIPLCIALRKMDMTHGIPLTPGTTAPAAVCYADDTNIIARSPQHASELYNTAQKFCEALGARLNLDKCVAIAATGGGGNLPNGIRILENNETTQILGIPFGTSITRHQQIDRVIHKMMDKTAAWSKIGRTIKGKVTIARSILASTIW